jgi:hypothetical protein
MTTLPHSYSSLFLLAMTFFLHTNAQSKPGRFDLQAMLNSKTLHPVNRSVSPLTDDPARKAVRLDQAQGMGVVWLGDGVFSNGSIEFDVRGKDEYQGSFVGIAFHGVDDKTFEAVYLRPFNFRTTDAVRKIHMVQYISMPGYDWSDLRTAFPGKYEKPIDPAPDPTGWVHVRVVMAGPAISVYINHSPNPSLQVEQLVKRKEGKIGLWAGNNSGGDYSNVTVSPSR